MTALLLLDVTILIKISLQLHLKHKTMILSQGKSNTTKQKCIAFSMLVAFCHNQIFNI
jgi:hypothetical protein